MIQGDGKPFLQKEISYRLCVVLFPHYCHQAINTRTIDDDRFIFVRFQQLH